MNAKAIQRTHLTVSMIFFGVMLVVSPGLQAEDKTGRLSSRDEEFVKHENNAGESTIKIGELGASKAQSHNIRMFAATIVTEHTQLNTQLKLLAAHKDLELPSPGGSTGGDGYRKLETASGFDFDKLFLAELESCHEKSVSKLEEAARSSRDVDLQRWVENTLPMLREHHRRLQELGTSIVATASPVSYSAPLGVESNDIRPSYSTGLVR
ncbi:MAG: DUF4142 domain-containing protein [Verrucomicrobiota bacterium]